MFKLVRKWQKMRNPLSAKNAPEEYQNLLKEILPQKTVDHPFYEVMAGDWPNELLTKNIIEKFPHANFKKIYEIHLLREEKKKEVAAKFSIKKAVGIVYSASTILIATVPEELVEKAGMNYANFKIGTFCLTLGLIVYVSIIFLPDWRTYSKAIERYSEMKYILKYIEIYNRENGYNANKKIVP